MTTKTDEQERAAFEAWYRHHHGDRDVYALDESGEYVDKQVQGAFNVWQARAALQSQDMERLQFIADEGCAFDTHVQEGGSCKYRLMWPNYEEWEYQAEWFDSPEGAIDHARRIEETNDA